MSRKEGGQEQSKYREAQETAWPSKSKHKEKSQYKKKKFEKHTVSRPANYGKHAQRVSNDTGTLSKPERRLGSIVETKTKLKKSFLSRSHLVL